MIRVSAPHKMLGVPVTPDIATCFPSVRRVNYAGTETALIPHRFHETKLLRNIGFDVPAPALFYYHFPHPPNEPPFDVQRRTVAMMTTEQRFYNLNGKGTGKTRCTMWAFDYLRSVGLAQKMLITCPISVMEIVWEAEVFKNFYGMKVQILYGTKAKRLKNLAKDADIYIINHAGIDVIKKELMARKDIDVIAIDELAAFRNARAKRTLNLKDLVETKVWAWGLTGDPTPEEPTDAFGQCKVLTPGTIPNRFSHFRDMTMAKVSAFRYVPKRDHKEVITRAMQPASRYTLDDIVELPELVEQVVRVPMGKDQLAAYEALRKDALALVQGSEVTAVNAGALYNKMLQVSLGYLYAREEGAEDRHVVTLDNEGRLDMLVEDIRSAKNKVIVFAPYRHAVEGITARLTAEGISHSIIHGDVDQKDRFPIFHKFQNTDDPKVLVAHPLCMAHGVTLTAADTTIWFGPCASNETFEQANARFRRIGQNKKQLLLLYSATPAEAKAYANLKAKKKVQDGVLAMFAEMML